VYNRIINIACFVNINAIRQFHASIHYPKVTTHCFSTLHVCGQINILKIHFANFDVKSPQIYDRFNVLIQRHRYLIMLARELADLISLVLLMELFIISLLLCIIGKYYVTWWLLSEMYRKLQIFIRKYCIYIQHTNIFFRVSAYPCVKNQ